jgi:chorismate mutase
MRAPYSFFTSIPVKPSLESPAGEAERELKRLRDAVDHVDEVLVRLLNQRARYAMQIGQVKSGMQLPVYSPDREKEIFANVERWSEGPLSDAALRRIFERIIDESRRVVRHASGDDPQEK